MIRMQSLLWQTLAKYISLLFSIYLLFYPPLSLSLTHTHTHSPTHNAFLNSTIFSLLHTHIVSLSFPLYLSNSVFVFVMCLFEFHLLLFCSFLDACLCYFFLSFFANMSITFVTLFYYLFEFLYFCPF